MVQNGEGDTRWSARKPACPSTFGEYARTYWKDYVGLALVGILGLVIYLLPPVPNRLFAITYENGQLVNPELAYPLMTNIIPIWLAALLGFTVPMVVISLCQIKYRDLADWNAGLLGVLYSLITSATFQVFIKWLIGGLRPHFFDVCKPDLSRIRNSGTGFQQIMVDSSICTGNQSEINDSLESFVSGHSTTAFAGFIFLALYLNAHLKVFGAARPRYWKFVCFYAALLAPTLISLTLTIDKFHHWYDILGGAVIGTAAAFGAYRSHFASIRNPKTNDIVLTDEGKYNDGNQHHLGSQHSVNQTPEHMV